MNLAVKKIELINWLTRQDKKVIEQIDELRKSTVEATYHSRRSEELNEKLDKSESNIKEGKTQYHAEVESYFKSKFKK